MPGQAKQIFADFQCCCRDAFHAESKNKIDSILKVIMIRSDQVHVNKCLKCS